jgi:hypothetical protein
VGCSVPRARLHRPADCQRLREKIWGRLKPSAAHRYARQPLDALDHELGEIAAEAARRGAEAAAGD